VFVSVWRVGGCVCVWKCVDGWCGGGGIKGCVRLETGCVCVCVCVSVFMIMCRQDTHLGVFGVCDVVAVVVGVREMDQQV
jgi:hypothetical protein